MELLLSSRLVLSCVDYYVMDGQFHRPKRYDSLHEMGGVNGMLLTSVHPVIVFHSFTLCLSGLQFPVSPNLEG